MFHPFRAFRVTDYTDAATLAMALTEYSWTLCTGFRFAGYLLLNDAISEDGAQEFAVVREDTMEQVESITASWMTTERMLAFLIGLRDGTAELVRMGPVSRAQVDNHPAGSCVYCA